MLKRLSIYLILIISSSLAACYEDVSVSLYEPGEYKGVVDPLVSLSKSPAHKERLRKRFKMVQTDR